MGEPDPSWDFLQPESKDRVVTALRTEFEAFWSLVVDPTHWGSPTACAGWDTADMVGHFVDATTSYIDGFDAARRGEERTSEPLPSVAEAYAEAARGYRSVPREELLDQLRDVTDRLFAQYDSLTSSDWLGLVVHDRYAGSLPATALATGGLGGYAVHGWDLRHGRGEHHPIAADTADLLVPFVFALWTFLADTASISEPFSVGVRTTGRNGGDRRVEVSNNGLVVTPEPLDGCTAVLDVDPGTLLLMAYNRVDAGTVTGDSTAVARLRSVIGSM